METSEICLLSALELRRRIAAREISPREAATAFLARIRATDDKVRAFVTIDEDAVGAMASDVEKRLNRGEDLALGGVP